MLLTTGDELSGAAMAVRALHDGRVAGWSDGDIVQGSPVVLSLTPPRLGAAPSLPTAPSAPPGPVTTIDHLGHREALRVRVRWLQELLARAAEELGDRLVRAGSLPAVDAVGVLRLEELAAMGEGGPPPSDVAERREWSPGPPLPVSFRLTTHGDLRPASVSSHWRRASGVAGMPASGGRVVGVVHHQLPAGTPPAGAILVTRHLEPQLAPVLGGLTGLVSETGSALSHLAILAREAGLATVVGVPDALDRFPPGTRLFIDGRTGEVEALDADPAPVVAESVATP
jgi:pyruvate,water dikinase